VINVIKKLNISKKILIISVYGSLLSISTQMLYSQLALYMRYELKITDSKIAVIDGFCEFLSYLIRIFSGILSDYMRNRKLLLVVGCLVLCLVKPMFAIANSISGILCAEIVERFGNGIQACPRDVFISELSSTNHLSSSFGLFKSFKTIGALLGTVISIVMAYIGDYKLLFWSSGIPALMAILALMNIGKGRKIQKNSNVFDNPFQKKYLQSFNKKFWIIIMLAGLYELGHFGESLLSLRVSKIISPRLAGITGIFVGIGQILFAYPVGLMADKCGRILMLKLCVALSIISYVLLFYSASIWMLLIIFVLCGQQASIQSLFLSLIGENIDAKLRGTAIGIFYCIIGVSYFAASSICGQLWEIADRTVFLYGAIVSLVSLVAIIAVQKYCFRNLK
jgi:MFS family permease